MSDLIIPKDFYGAFARYFLSKRCFIDESLKQFNKGKILADEIVCFDCALMMYSDEIIANEIPVIDNKKEQILAVVIRPEIEPNYVLENDYRFQFCGYDLVENSTCISAITNCGADFDNAIDYSALNDFGLIPTYREAVTTQISLYDEYPEEHHANCDIVEVWRYAVNSSEN